MLSTKQVEQARKKVAGVLPCLIVDTINVSDTDIRCSFESIPEMLNDCRPR